MSTKDIWMPVYIGDYLSDTQLLTTEQHGAYLLLIMAYWKNKKPLPDDDKVLRSIARLEQKQWKSCRAVLEPFFTVCDGFWHHKRIEAELERASLLQEKASERAQKAATIRWGRERQKPENDAPSIAPSMPRALPEHMQMQCKSQSQLHSPKTMPVPRKDSSEDILSIVSTNTGEVYEIGGAA
jgi:uncharacterized protein YdaU (DUF1376 family)